MAQVDHGSCCHSSSVVITDDVSVTALAWNSVAFGWGSREGMMMAAPSIEAEAGRAGFAISHLGCLRIHRLSVRSRGLAFHRQP